MKYLCTGDWGTPEVGADCDHVTEPRALRHARAMAAVLRAAKAWQIASARFERSCEADALVSEVAPVLQTQLDAEKRLLAATARLVAVEKEVSRGK